MELSRLVSEILSLVSLEMYGARGVMAGDRLLVSALREGAANLYLLDDTKGLIRLNKAPISGVAEPPYGSSRAVIYRDVAKGRELHQAYLVSVEKPGSEEPLTESLEPMRLLSVVDKGDRVYLTGVTGEGIALFEAKPRGEARRVGLLPGFAVLADAHEGVGAGIVFQPDGKIRLFTIDLETGEHKLHPHPGSVAAARFHGGKLVVALEGAGGVGFYSMPPEGGELEPLALPHTGLEEYGATAVNYIATLPGGELLVIARRHGRSRVFVDGEPMEGPEGNYGPAYAWRGGLAVSHTSLRTPPRILHLKDSGWSEVLGPEVPPWLSEALGEARFHWVESFDGARVPVFTLESGRAGRPGPTVVLVHGGPFSEDLDAWDIFAAALALAGFNVVMPNYRGSTGYGEEWRSKIIGDPCGGELEDIVYAARWARESGLASYTVVMGYSYGGYATMCALTRKPGTFKAGVAGASVVDWEEMYELSDPAFRQFIELLLGKDRDKWRERSPISYVDNLRDPLCIIHPQNDSRTPLKPVLHFMEKALEAGKTFEAHIAPDMGHAVNTVDDIVKLLLPAVVFLYRIREGGV